MSKDANPEAGNTPEATQEPEAGNEGTATSKSSGEGTGTPESGKTFTQEDVNRIVGRELKKLEPKVQAAAKWEEHEAKSKSEAERAEAAAAEREQRINDREARTNSRLIAAEIRLAAIDAGIRKEALGLVVKALADSEDIEVDDDGNVQGAGKALKDFLKENEYLKSKQAGKSGAEFNGQDGSTLDEQIAAAEGKGDWATSRRLKMQKLTASAG